MNPAQKVFDELRMELDGRWRSVPVEEWLRLDVAKRVDMIAKRQVQFLLAGKPVSTTVALKSLQPSA